MLVGAVTDLGRVRRVNEDAWHAGPGLLVVADGMGGYAAGEVASQLAVATIAAWTDWEQPAVALRAAFLVANRVVLARAANDPACAGMGTTMTACVVAHQQAFVAHVGDSRLYLWREGQLSCVTADHSLVGEMMRAGVLSEEEARIHPRRHILTRALGAEPEVDVDIISTKMAARDRLLLCTDGLHTMVHDAEIARLLHQPAPPADVASRLVQVANARGGSDNITVVVAEITEEDLV